MTRTTLLILGASGDLTKRLLLPGIGSLLAKEPDRDVRIVGADRAALSGADFTARVRGSLSEGGASGEVLERVCAAARYYPIDVTNAEALNKVLAELADTDRLVMYFALPPAVTEKACKAMLPLTLADNVHLAMEKPFGHDEASARALNKVVAQLAPDSRVHRVDHFLGKSTVLDIMALRFANRMLQAVWSNEHIESIEIAYDEALALEGRAGYYDHAGALVDMIQSHLLQVLSVVAMEPPFEITDRELRDAKSAVLRATRLWGDDPKVATHRARYTEGNIKGRAIPNYLDENGVDPARDTETMAQVTVEVANARWAGVPITLRSGKALGETRKHVVITFADPKYVPAGLKGADPKDRLIIGLSPDVMELRLTTNTAEDPLGLEQSVMRTELRKSDLEAYGEVLSAILDGHVALSVRGDAAEECWRITDQILRCWRSGEVEMEEYPAGSAVPEAWHPALG